MIQDWAADYIGLPFLDLGRTRAGLDCWGLYILVRRERWGQQLEGFEGWYNGGDRISQAAIVGARADFLSSPVTPGDEVLGDAVIMRMAGLTSHIGMVLGDGMMLHVVPGADTAVEPYTSGRWARRVEGFRRP